MDEDITSDLVIAEEMPLSKSPEPTILSTDHKTEEINNSSNLIKNDILTTTKIQADQMQLKTNAVRTMKAKVSRVPSIGLPSNIDISNINMSNIDEIQ